MKLQNSVVFQKVSAECYKIKMRMICQEISVVEMAVLNGDLYKEDSVYNYYLLLLSSL